MKLLNINSYYLSSSVHNSLQLEINNIIEVENYVPISNTYEIRQECLNSNLDNCFISKCFKNIDRVSFIYKNKKIMRDLTKRVDLDEYDLIHAHSLFTNGYIAYKIFKNKNIPYVVTVRDTDINIFLKKRPLMKNLGLKILLSAKKVIFLSDSYKKKCLKVYFSYKNALEDKFYVIPNGLNEFWLKNKYIKPKSCKKKYINIAFVGKICKRKNLKTVIKTCEYLNSIGYKCCLNIAGSYENKKYYNLIKNRDYINYFKSLNQNELLKIYRKSDVFIMPSITESFGLVYLEAMSQSLPVIYTKEEGFDYLFNDGEVGYRTDCYDFKYIGQCVIKIINNYNRISKNCLINVDKFNWKLIGEKHIDLYKEILNCKEEKSG